YLADLERRAGRLKRPLKVVCACGNGTAGLFAPRLLRAMGAEVVELHCTPDWTFPNYNPNPEDMEMLDDMRRAVRETGADLALGFDGDGDRCGVVDNEGGVIFSDKIGVLIARDLARRFPGARFVVDVKSTALFHTDPVLTGLGAETDYFKTGHSYIKRRTTELDAIAGFEKSGHFFFRPPVGLGYDDGLVSAIAVLHMLDNNPGRAMADLYRDLPVTHSTPTMSPHCPDERKYEVVDRIIAHYRDLREKGETVAGQPIVDVNTVNGVRFTLADGTWGLVRASSNKPELVVVCESPVSEAMMRAVWEHIRDHLAGYPEIGEFNQTV
ncbi:MAG TPA: phosphomannomutase/phosphoglucomutase, partial [Thermopetrobacter sp.]|nr:phosphomannomutase/phosphoglucomutase [Thermopetrobacter sp.]